MDINYIKNSVGYSESSNKEEFMKGASIMKDWLEKEHKKEIEQLKSTLFQRDNKIQEITDELCTIARIIKRYS